MAWEDTARQAAEESLPVGFRLFSFHVTYLKSEPRLQVCLDKLADPYGSPTISDCEQFARVLDLKLSALAESDQIPDNYSLEVASPGAERELAMPDDLDRFKEQPMKVMYSEGEEKTLDRVLTFLGVEGAITHWQLADVKANRKSGAYRKGKKVPRYDIPLENIARVNLHLDF